MQPTATIAVSPQLPYYFQRSHPGVHFSKVPKLFRPILGRIIEVFTVSPTSPASRKIFLISYFYRNHRNLYIKDKNQLKISLIQKNCMTLQAFKSKAKVVMKYQNLKVLAKFFNFVLRNPN